MKDRLAERETIREVGLLFRNILVANNVSAMRLLPGATVSKDAMLSHALSILNTMDDGRPLDTRDLNELIYGAQLMIELAGLKSQPQLADIWLSVDAKYDASVDEILGGEVDGDFKMSFGIGEKNDGQPGGKFSSREPNDFDPMDCIVIPEGSTLPNRGGDAFTNKNLMSVSPEAFSKSIKEFQDNPVVVREHIARKTEDNV